MFRHFSPISSFFINFPQFSTIFSIFPNFSPFPLPVSGFRFPVSGFRFRLGVPCCRSLPWRLPVSGFRFSVSGLDLAKSSLRVITRFCAWDYNDAYDCTLRFRVASWASQIHANRHSPLGTFYHPNPNGTFPFVSPTRGLRVGDKLRQWCHHCLPEGCSTLGSKELPGRRIRLPHWSRCWRCFHRLFVFDGAILVFWTTYHRWDISHRNCLNRIFSRVTCGVLTNT